MNGRGRPWTGSGVVGVTLAALLVTACGPGQEREAPEGVNGAPAALQRDGLETALRETLNRSSALAERIEDELRPVPLLTPGQEAHLRRHGNAVHVARARALGVRPADDAQIRTLLDEGRLVQLEDSTEHWIVRENVVRRALVTPDVPPLLREIARRFQAVLDERGLPPYRLEITSVLRTAADQAALRRTNPNAAAGTSSHEFGTTLDIAYEAFAPPLRIPEEALADAPDHLVPDLERVAALALESVSGRKSRELKAFLGGVLTELQAEGAVLVILERQQPVFHLTVGRRSGEG